MCERLDFVKMHGCGNDFVVVDGRPGARLTPEAARLLADRRRGVGCDQVIGLEASSRADVFMRILNADGGEAGACGNAARCVASLLGAPGQTVTIETIAGVLEAVVLAEGRVRVAMGVPRLAWTEIPLARAADTLALPLEGAPAAASLGNPHVTFFVDGMTEAEAVARGRAVEGDALFPERANVGFAQVMAPDRIRLRVWERGAGLTLACGSGACAALVNAHRRGLAGRQAIVVMDGGALEIAWRADGTVTMTGPAVRVFEGSMALPRAEAARAAA